MRHRGQNPILFCNNCFCTPRLVLLGCSLIRIPHLRQHHSALRTPHFAFGYAAVAHLKNCLPIDKQFFVYVRYYLSLFSHCWLAIPQLVLQADWQEVWHSPQPPFFALSQRFAVSRVLICSIFCSSVMFIYIKSIS